MSKNILDPIENAKESIESNSDNSIKIKIELDGYDKLKSQLNDIESQIKRILENSNKLKTINTHYGTGYRDNSNLENIRPANFPSPGNPPKQL